MPVTLILFCKRPAPGVGKQRLAQALGADAAFRIASGLHDCALAQLRQWPGYRVIAPASAADAGWYRNHCPWADLVLPQPEGNLGQRINRIDRQLRRDGHGRLLIIGSDMPEQTPEMLEEAAAALGRYDIVLSPAGDGGVTLMANRVPWPDLADLPWSTDRLGSALASCCTDGGLSLGWGRPCNDVDLPQDLERLAVSLAPDPRPDQRALFKLLRELI